MSDEADATPISTVPAKIYNITVENDSKTERTIKWEQLGGVDISFYEVELRKDGDEPQLKQASTNSLLLRDLDVNSKYTVSVTAINSAGRGEESEEEKFETGPNALSLALASNDGFTAKIEWKEEWNDKEAKRDSCYAEQYEITWQDSDGSLKSAKTHCKEYTIVNLAPGASYSVWIAEIIKTERVLISNTVNFDGAPKMPIDIQVSPLESSPCNSLVVMFDDENKKPMKYKVTACSITAGIGGIVESERRSVLIKDLLPGESYDIQVVTMNGKLQSRAASYGRLAQTYPKGPEDVKLNQNNGGMKLSWKQLDIKPNFYRVQCEANNIKETYETEDTTFFLDDVKFATTYRFRVAAVNKAGCSEFSEKQEEMTAPSPPTNIRVFNNPKLPETSFIVSFDDNNPSETTYEVVALSMEGIEVASEKANTKSTTLNDLTAGHTYKVYVVAIYGGLTSERAFYIQEI